MGFRDLGYRLYERRLEARWQVRRYPGTSA